MYEDFKTRLKILRKEKGLTQEQLARALDIPESTIRRYESTEDKTPKRERLEMIADYFRCTVDYLIGRSDDRFSSVSTGNDLKVDPFLIFDLVDKLSDDEIIAQYKHIADGKKLDEKIIRNHLQHIRLLKSLPK